MNIYPPGTRIAGQYEIAGRPLMGGMGIVYVCLDHGEDRPVALKTFRPEYLPDRAARDRFLREGTHWVELGRHPNIVHAYEICRSPDGLEVFIVLGLVAAEEGKADASLGSWNEIGPASRGPCRLGPSPADYPPRQRRMVQQKLRAGGVRAP